jgi:YaiO family outer membrane protein
MGDLVKSYSYDPAGKITYPEDRFTENLDFQYEFEFYPKITKKSYLFIHGGWGQRAVLFPRWRAALEYFYGLPWGFEVSLGFRYLYFENAVDPDVWIYTGSVSKYLKNWYFSFRPYFVPRDAGLEHSYFLEARRYLDLADNFIFAEIGYGITPDDPSRFIRSPIDFDHRAYSIRAGIQHLLARNWLIWFQLGYMYEEYTKDTWRNVYKGSVKIGYYF